MTGLADLDLGRVIWKMEGLDERCCVRNKMKKSRVSLCGEQSQRLRNTMVLFAHAENTKKTDVFHANASFISQDC